MRMLLLRRSSVINTDDGRVVVKTQVCAQKKDELAFLHVKVWIYSETKTARIPSELASTTMPALCREAGGSFEANLLLKPRTVMNRRVLISQPCFFSYM